MLPTITLNDLMRYNDALFNDILLPDDVNGELLVNTILMQYGEMAVVCTDWEILKKSIDHWFMTHSIQLDRLYRDYSVSYDPLYNKEYHVEETRTPDLRKDSNTTGNSSSVTNSNDNGSFNNSGTNTRAYEGFQSSGFHDVERDTPVNSGSNHNDSQINSNGNSTSKVTETETGTETIKRHEYGNVSAITAAQIIKHDLNLWNEFSFYDIAAKLWAVDNMILVY